ncbi:MAG: tetratricopeptide repeat protein [Aestuariibacter sp.]
MKRLILITLYFVALTTPVVSAQEASIKALNFNIKKCFEQTELGAKGSKRACREVIWSNIATRENKAIAYYNRAVINLNHQDKKAALEDFENAVKLSPDLTASVSQATMLIATNSQQ